MPRQLQRIIGAWHPISFSSGCTPRLTGKLLLVSSLIFIGITLILPYLPFVSVFGFVPLPMPLMLAMIGLTTLYILATELAKKYFYSRGKNALI